MGEAITTLISEMVVLLLSFYCIKRYLEVEWDFRHLFSVSIAGIGVVIICVLCKMIIKNTIIQLIIAILLSALTYCAVLISLKNEILMNLIAGKLKNSR